MASVLILGDAVQNDAGSLATLQRFGVDDVVRAASLDGGLDLLMSRHFDVVFVEADRLDDAMLQQLDRAVRRERNTEVVGTAPVADPAIMLRAMRAGIQEFLLRPIASGDLSAALERMMRRRATTATAGSVIAVYGAKGGLGCSVLASNLAAALAAPPRARRVAVVDLVLPGGEQKLHFNITPGYDIGQLVGKVERLDVELLKSVMAPARDGVWLLAASDDPEVDERIDAGVVTTVISQLRQSYHCTVVDCERQLTDRTLAVLDAADQVLMVTQLNVSALRATQRALAIFRRLGYPAGKLCVLVNRYPSGELLSIADAEEVLKSDVFFRLPNDYKLMTEANSRGVTVSEVDKDSKLAQAFEALANKLTGHHGEAATTNGMRPSRLRSLFARRK
jgi:pilus assembly protein CpaE